MRQIAAALLLSVTFAIAGFSYALATGSGDDMCARSVGARQQFAGSSTIALVITNPLLPGGGRDLGDAVIGSSLGRYINAQGGVAPYTFTALQGNSGPLSNVNLTLTGDPVNDRGVVASSKLGGRTGPFDFIGSVSDSFPGTPNSASDRFVLNVVPTIPDNFRFALDKVSNLTQNLFYMDSLYVINGVPPYTFSASNVTLSGDPSVTSLAQVGMQLLTDGTLTGRPFRSGTLSFLANATDSHGATASSRNRTRSGQPINLSIAASTDVAATLFVTKKLKVTYGANGKPGTVSFSAQASTAGIPTSDLRGQPLELSVGAYDTSPARSAEPTLRTHTIRAYIAADGKIVSRDATMTVKGGLSSSGGLSVSVKDPSVGNDLGPITSGTSQPVIIHVQVGNKLADTETVLGDFACGISARTGCTITSPPKGGKSPNPQGAFLILATTGVDASSPTGDKWKLNALAQAPTGVAVTDVQMVMVNIGKSSQDVFTVTNRGGILTYKGSSKNPGTVKSLSADLNRGKMTVMTNVLASTDSNIPPGAGQVAMSSFPIKLTFMKSDGTKVFAGASSTKIAPVKKGWTSKIK